MRICIYCKAVSNHLSKVAIKGVTFQGRPGGKRRCPIGARGRDGPFGKS